VTLGSIREQIYGTAPPRGLFCEFPLGRPLGIPNDPAFQRRVLDHAFGLLDATSPGVIDFPETISDDPQEVLVCPLPVRHDPDAHPAIDEARGLRPAYDRAVRKFGNRAGAVRHLDADAIPDALAAFIRVTEGTPWKEAGIPGIPARCAQDIRGYYEMAAMEIAGHTPAAWAGYRWYRDETQAGQIIKAAQQTMKDSGVKEALWRFLLPLDAQAS